jgi:hypothetical protein
MTLGKTFAEKERERKGDAYDYDVAKLRRRIAELEAECERLRKAGSNEFIRFEAEHEENKRLRKALQYCADIPDARTELQMIRNVQDVARKALGEENE